jgi:hypothetical protein
VFDITTRAFALAMLFAILVSVALLTACSDDDRCRTDFDCKSGQVCEPEGCARACTLHQDCEAPALCQQRRVEEGKVCR